jgi:hypothetical protein
MAGSTWRESFRRRLSSLVIAAAGEAVAIAIVLSGPREPVGFSLRLPLLALAVGGIAAAARWRKVIVLGRYELVVRTLARTRRIPWPAVASVRRRTSHITIRVRNGRGVSLRTGADTFYVADAIDAALAAMADPALEADAPAEADAPQARVMTRRRVAAAATAAGGAGEPAPVATPWLVLNGTTGVALLAAKGYESNPALMAGLLGFAGATCLVVLGGCLADWVRARG